MKRLLTLLVLVTLGIAAWAQRTGVRQEVLSSWNKASGLDNVYDMTSKALTPAPKGYEAVYIGHYGRHGSRYAYTDKTYTILQNLLVNGQKADNLTPYGAHLLQELQPFWEHVKYRVGDLTPLGWQQHRFIAATMVKNYPSAFTKGAKVDACSSASERALVSMASFLTELGRRAPAVEIYAHESLLDANATRPNLGKNPLRYNGPKLEVPYEESMEAFFLRRFPEYRTVLGRLFKDPDAALGSRKPWEVFFHLYMFVAGMNSLPEEVRADVSGLLTPQEYATLWETDNYARFCEYYPYQRPNSSILQDFVRKADAALAEGRRGADLRFGHDHVLMSLLLAMDIDDFATVPESNDDLVYWFQSFRSPMATNLQLVYYRPRKGRAGETLVKVLLNGEEVRVGDLEPVSGPYYKWEDMRAFLNSQVARFTYQIQPGEPAKP